MTNTSDTFWSADGVSLQTYAHNIETLDITTAPPPYRGSDITIPYVPGQRWVPKQADSRTIPLAMWVRDIDDNGNTPSNRQNGFDDNWRALRNLLWAPGRQIALKKQFKVGGVLRSATAMAEFAGGLEPKKIGRFAGKFVVDLKLADPYFYDDELKTFTLVNGDQAITVQGDAETARVNLTINGARTNAIIMNKSLGMQVEYHDALLTGDIAQIDVQAFSATTSPSGKPSFKSSGKIRHTGAAQWLTIKPGTNTVNLASSFGAGTVSLQVRGAWL